MYRSAPSDVSPGARLGAALFAEGGWPLLKAGTTLGPRHLQVVADLGYSRIVLLDEGEAPSREFVPPAVRTAVERALADSSNFLVEAWRRRAPLGAGAGASLDAALRQTLPGFIADVCRNEALTLPGPARTGPAHWLDDAINGAAMAVYLGHTLHFAEAALEQIAYGMLLRDAAQLTFPPELLHRPGALSETDWAQVRTHPRRAYDLLAALNWGGEMARLLVLQHHERRDGSGYPAGLGGGEARWAPGLERLHVVAELAAVADVFHALSVDRPHRSAYASAAARSTLRGLAEGRLHGAMVRELLDCWRPPAERAPAEREAGDEATQPAREPTVARSPGPSDEAVQRQAETALARALERGQGRAAAESPRAGGEQLAPAIDSHRPASMGGAPARS